jgi:UDP-glucose 4-epimerase
MSCSILVTGGAGFIGSHTCVALLDAGYEVAVLDNLSNSKQESIRRVELITGRRAEFIKADLLDREGLYSIFANHDFDGVLHFAGLKAVGESTEKPLAYYRNNVSGTANLLDAMNDHGVRSIVFSSSCPVYGAPDDLPIREDFPLFAVSPYGQTKLTVEHMLRDLYESSNDWRISILRYFNPVGAHHSGRIGEDPLGVPNNLLPFICQVAVGLREKLSVFGGDYETPDGTCIRDYIHVVDVAEGHVAALKNLDEECGVKTHNLGTGFGHTVLEVIDCFEKATGLKIPYRIVDRRPGDTRAVYADPSLAETELGWRATRTLEEICTDAWRWQSANPAGYP